MPRRTREHCGAPVLALLLAAGSAQAQNCGTPWVQRSAIGPSERYGHAMAYDSDRQRVVLFGGYSANNTASNQTWEWDGSQWLDRTVPGGPGARHGHAIVYDAARHRTVLFGGAASGPVSSDTWEWDGTMWANIPSFGPSARTGAAMTFDTTRGRALLFGGVGETYRGDTWEWDGAVWTLRSGGGPAARYDASMAFDSARGRAVLFGGRQNVAFQDTWEWDGSGAGAWTLVDAGGAGRPGPRAGAGLVFDSARARCVLFGGDDSATTWEWDGATAMWIFRTSGIPAPRQFTAMAYDAARGQSVVFGGSPFGSTRLADTWTWDGTAAAAPTITQQPMPLNVPSSSPVLLHIAATGDGPLLYRWRRDGMPLVDGGTISGTATDTLSINPAAYSDSGLYDAVVTSGCNIPVLSSRVGVTVTCAAYYANCDGSTVPPILNVNDFICFQTRYSSGDPYANCDGSTIPPMLNVNDFICFQTKFVTGCP